MPSPQDCAERLREQAYRTLLPQIRDLEQELQNISSSLNTGVSQIGRKLEALSRIELPTTEVVLGEILGDVTRDRDLKTSELVVFARDLRKKETQEEILGLLLEFAQKYSVRAALFAVRGNRYVGWSSRGYSEEIARDIGASSFLRSDSPMLEDVLAGGNAVIAPELNGDVPLKTLKEQSGGPYCLIPLIVLQRPVAVLLAEGVEKEINRDELSILAEFAMARLENIALKVLYELTASKPAAGMPSREESAAAAELAPAPQPTPSMEPIQAAVPSEPPVPDSFQEPVPEPAPRFDISAFEMREPEAAPEPAPTEAKATAEKMAAAQVDAPAPIPEPVKVQPQEVKPVPEEEKLHVDAKRFARLLVSEIKLYNEARVVEGRENHDLYLRLKRDIDRSREMYEKRVSPSVSRRIDYFHDEIIRILGDNDPTTLGSDYPGPRVDS